MSYTFSSPSLPTGFSIVGSKLLATANAPAFTGNITIALTDGVTTVNKVVAIDRRATTASALFTQILDLVSNVGPIDSFVDFEVIVQTILSEVGFNNSFSLLPTSSLIAIAGATDEFTLGASVMADNITANGVVFNYRFLDPNNNVVATFALAESIRVYREYGDSPQTSEEAIGCESASAASFRASLLDATRVKFGQPGISAAFCSVRTFVTDGPLMISYVYYTNNGVGGSGGG